VTAAQKLLNIDHVDAIYGPMCSSEALSIRSLTEPKKILMIIAAATSKTLTGAGHYIFRTISSDSVRSYTAADYAYAQGFRKGAFLFDDNQDALTQEKNDAKEEFTKDGGQVVDEDSFGTNDTDFKTQLVKVKSSGVDVIFVGSFYKAMALTIKQARDLGIKTQFVALDESVNVQQFFDLAGKDAEGTIVPAMVIPSSTESVAFAARYKAKFGIDPTVYTAEGYDAMSLLLKAIATGSVSGDSVRANLLKIGNNYPGVSGIITFDTNGDVQKPTVIKVARNGQFVQAQ
jgi:branched-chain amino acid transport system substrate-binding protein